MNVHTAVRHRLDVLAVWAAAMRETAPWARLVVWYAGDRPSVGDELRPMPPAGIGAARWVVSRLPRQEQRLFVESDMIPVRPWSPDDYPGELVLLEGSPGRWWPAVTIARPWATLGDQATLLPQRRIRDTGCPGWLPAELCEPAIQANAKVVGRHWLHLDKMHRPEGADPAKARLLELLAARMPAPPAAPVGLGDLVAAGLGAVGITADRVRRWTGRPCGCGRRRAALNRLLPDVTAGFKARPR